MSPAKKRTACDPSATGSTPSETTAPQEAQENKVVDKKKGEPESDKTEGVQELKGKKKDPEKDAKDRGNKRTDQVEKDDNEGDEKKPSKASSSSEEERKEAEKKKKDQAHGFKPLFPSFPVGMWE